MEFQSNQKIPANPVKFITDCIKRGCVFWTYHINLRITERRIPRNMILDSADSYEIIKEYPKDKYFPSYLVRSEHEGSIFHVLFAVDVEGDNIRIVTAYYPNPDEWDAGMRRRR